MELRTTNQKEKEFGYKVRDHLREKILGKVVTIKYGRLLEDLSVNQWLIDGGTKKLWFQ